MKREKLTTIIASLYILLFIYAGVSKLMDVALFRVQISQSPLLFDVAGIVSWSVPLLELFIAILLVFEKTRLIGLYAALTAMIAFTVYIVLASRFSDFVPCSCGGVIQHLSWDEHLVFNLFFVALGITGILLDNTVYNMNFRFLR